MAAKDFESIKKEVKSTVASIIEVPESKLTEQTKFVEDLGIDSMMALEIVAKIEKHIRL